MGLINYSKKNNNSSDNFSFGKVLPKRPTKNVLLKKVLPNIKVSGRTEKVKFENYFKEMAGSSIREITKEIKKRDEFETKDKKKLIGAFIKHYAPKPNTSGPKEELSGERKEANINILRSAEKADYVEKKGGLGEGIGAKSRAEILKRAKWGIFTEDFTKATSAAGHNGKEGSGPHLVGAVSPQHSAGALTDKNRSPFVSASAKLNKLTGAGVAASSADKLPGGFQNNPRINKPSLPPK